MGDPADLGPVAHRIDRRGAYREEMTFLDFGGVPVFGVMHAPARQPDLGVVICSSILVEHITNYQREVMLARALATHGFAVQRFHYRGTGHSGGDETAVTLSSMVDDTRTAAAQLQRRAGLSRVAFVGTRWGGMVAAAAAAADPTSPLVLWEPVVDPGRFFREMTRGRRMLDLRDAAQTHGVGEAGSIDEGSRRGPSAVSLSEELDRNGWADMLGFTLHRALYASGEGKRLDALLADRSGPVLLIQFARSETLKPEYGRLHDAQRARGGVLDVRVVNDDPAWFFSGNELRSADTLAGMTVQWLLGHQPPASRA